MKVTVETTFLEPIHIRHVKHVKLNGHSRARTPYQVIYPNQKYRTYGNQYGPSEAWVSVLVYLQCKKIDEKSQQSKLLDR